MNSTLSERATGFKMPISTSNAPEIFQRFDEAIQYLKGLRVENESKSIFSSSVHTPFTGFYNIRINFRSIFQTYVETGKADQVVTHRFSQDLLESFFDSIRSMAGETILYN